MATEILGTLRSTLRARLGYAGAGAAAGVQQEILNSILQQAQIVLYWTHDWARLRRYEDKTVGTNQYLIDYPTAANPDRIKSISILRTNVWSPPLKKGISPEMYTNQSINSVPYRWEPYAQIELFPKADQQYTARIFYIKNLDRFTQDGDASTIDGDLIFTVALADAKSHYRHPDAPAYVERATNLLVKLRGKSFGQDVFSPSGYEEEPMAKPQVV